MRIIRNFTRPLIRLISNRKTYSTQAITALNPFIDLSQEFIESKQAGRPLIALESTILTHGLPPKTAVELKTQLEQIALQLGVTPVHIAIIEGRIKVGLSYDQLFQLLDPLQKTHVLKLGRRDLPSAITQKLTGGTTVSAIMAISHLVGIKVFATGGIGGVHRGATQTMDVSSDLTELGRTPVAVICAGVKSILDIPLTLEYLETLGVPTISFSETKEFPAFYSPKSGHLAPFHSSSTLECAQMIHNSDLLDLRSGTLIAVPIPNQFTKSAQLIQNSVDQAVRESVELGINSLGKSVTPWLLNRVKELSKGQSVDANIGLIKNNVDVASRIAKDYTNLISGARHGSSVSMIPVENTGCRSHKPVDATTSNEDSRMMVVGAAAIDITSRAVPSTKDQPSNLLINGSTIPGNTKISLGGVGLNIARASFHSGLKDVLLVSPLAKNCPFGTFLTNQIHQIGLRSDGLQLLSNSSTGIVNMFLDGFGDLIGGVANLKSVENLDPQVVGHLIRNTNPKVVCFDANLSSQTIYQLLKTCHESDTGIITAFEPTSISKSTKIVASLVKLFKTSKGTKKLTILFPNIKELIEIHERGLLSNESREINEVLESVEYFNSISNLTVDSFFLERVRRNAPDWVTRFGVLQISLKLLPFVGTLIIKNGRDGLVFLASHTEVTRSKSNNNRPRLNLIPSFDTQEHFEKKNPDHHPWVFNQSKTLFFKYFPAVQIDNPASDQQARNPSQSNHTKSEDKQSPVGSINVTGAGDTLCGSILSSIALHDKKVDSFDWDLVIDSAQRMAVQTLRSDESVGGERWDM